MKKSLILHCTLKSNHTFIGWIYILNKTYNRDKLKNLSEVIGGRKMDFQV